MLRPWPTGSTDELHDRAPLRPPLRRPVLRPEPARAGDRRDQRPAARHRRVLGRPDDVRLQARVPGGEALPRPDRVRVARGHPGQPRLPQRRLRALRAALRRAQLGARASAAVTVVAVDSTEPDLDHGQIGRGRYAGSRSSSRRRASCASSSATTICCPCRGPGASATSSTTPVTRSRCCSGGGTPRPLGAQARPVRLEAREPVRRQHGHGLVAAAPGQHEALLQRRRGLRQPRRRLAQAPVPRPGADHPVLARHVRVREVHGPDRGRGDVAVVTQRALALIDVGGDEVCDEAPRALLHHRRVVLSVDEGEATQRHRAVVTSSSIRPVYFSYSNVSSENWMIRS